MANDIWREQQSVLTWIETDKDGYRYIRHQCPECSRTHRCHPVDLLNPVNGPRESVYIPFNPGERVRFIDKTFGNTQDNKIFINFGDIATIIEDREMNPGRHRLFVTLDKNGIDCWIAANVVEKCPG